MCKHQLQLKSIIGHNSYAFILKNCNLHRMQMKQSF